MTLNAVSLSLTLLAVAILTACGGGGGGLSVPPERKWYVGGTLHEKSALEWQEADHADKLATCADFVAKLWKMRGFKARIQDSITSMDDLKPYAEKLVTFLDAATEKHPDEARNRKMYVNQTVAAMATAGLITLGWAK